MKDPKRFRWLTLLAALGLLYVGIDRMFFDKIVGSDPLARIERTLAILVGALLVPLSISLFVAAWTGRPLAAMNTNSIKGKLLQKYRHIGRLQFTDESRNGIQSIVLSRENPATSPWGRNASTRGDVMRLLRSTDKPERPLALRQEEVYCSV
jgi:hypothetical protein